MNMMAGVWLDLAVISMVVAGMIMRGLSVLDSFARSMRRMLSLRIRVVVPRVMRTGIARRANANGSRSDEQYFELETHGDYIEQQQVAGESKIREGLKGMENRDAAFHAYRLNEPECCRLCPFQGQRHY